VETACDVAVIGGGPAGAAAALMLGRLGLRATILESKPTPVWKIGETLAPESRQVLQNLGVWDEFLEDGHLPSWGAFSLWGADEQAERDFIFNPHGCGWQLDRARFETLLQERAEAAGAAIWRGATVSALERREEMWQLIAGELCLRSQWLIDATGRASVAARHLGQKRVALDQLVSIYAVATAAEHRDEDSRTFVEARPTGWWYSALMPGNRRTVAWQTDADLLSGEHWREPAWFHQLIQETRRLKELLHEHRYSFSQPPRLTSAQSARIELACGEFWLAVGDAAQSFDPLSGQGIFHALFTGYRAATALAFNWPGSGRMAGYAEWLDHLWTRFLIGRKRFYGAEHQWPDEPFWLRRQFSSRTDVPPPSRADPT
jgi:2-polyprenyl-6-methoxyphenol hydroxylase-like FAD-dependent oxidoreductase